MIRLQPFTPADFDALIEEIPDARFLMQWAGPQYVFPLTADQLTETLSKTVGKVPTFCAFKAVRRSPLATVGHIQLINIDKCTARCVLGRVLIFKAYRGCGFGRAMVAAAVREAFETLGMNEIELNVFDFNIPALNLYQQLGFCPFQLVKGACKLEKEDWNLIKMKLSRDTGPGKK